MLRRLTMATGRVKTGGQVLLSSTISGLTYYLSDSPGGIDTGVGTVTKKIGLGLPNNYLQILNII